MTILDNMLASMEETHPDIKVLYTLWLGMLTIEVMDKRTGKTCLRVFPGLDSSVSRWFDELQEAM